MTYSGKAAVLGSAVLALAATPAMAHHSFAMFDMSKNVTVKGVVKEFQWTNPHVWVELLVTEGGAQKSYSYEGGAVAVLKRNGWVKDSIKVGDTITIVGHPFKNGREGGSLERVTLPDGRTVGAGDAVPGALQVPGVR
ncbi:MAG: DUF6152 family protein [Caulobacteraceae bacterium]